MNMALGRIKLLVLTLTFILFNGDVVRCQPEVKLLHVVFRHGEKIPHAEFQNYPNDPYRNHSYYPLISGGLTNEGKMREYKIGKMLRYRYDNFFGSIYSPEAIYARSSEVPRAKMSLQLVLAALFPPVGEQDWNPNLLWQPVDTFNEPEDKDLIFFPRKCPLWINEYKKLFEDEEIQRLIEQHKDTMDYLTKHSGKLINTPEAVYYLYNLFREQRMQNLTLPEWARKVYPHPMRNITILHFDLISCNTKLRRFGGGFMLAKITDDIKDLKGGTLKPKGRKAFLFSGHEENVSFFSHTLGMKEPDLPDYGSAIIIETLEDREQYFVRIFLWTGVTEELKIQKIPGCDEICPLDKFIRLLNGVIPNDCEKKCAVPSQYHKNNSAATRLSIEYINLIVFGILPIIIAKTQLQ